MAEAIGLASGLLTLVSTALTIATYTSTALCSIAHAPAHIAAIADEVSSFHSVMGTLQGLLDGGSGDDGLQAQTQLQLQPQQRLQGQKGGIVVTACLAGDLGREVGRAVGTLREIGMIVARRSGGGGSSGSGGGSGDTSSSRKKGGGGGLWWKVRWAVVDEKEVERLRAVLASQKIMISLAIATANLANTSSTRSSAERLEQEVAALKQTVTAFLARVDSPMQPDHHLFNMGGDCASISKTTKSKRSEATDFLSTEAQDRPRSLHSDSSHSTYETARSSWENGSSTESRLPFNLRKNDSQSTLNNSIFSFDSVDTLIDAEPSPPKMSDMGKISAISKAIDVISLAKSATEQRSMAVFDKESTSLRRKWSTSPNKTKKFSWSAMIRVPSRRAVTVSS